MHAWCVTQYGNISLFFSFLKKVEHHLRQQLKNLNKYNNQKQWEKRQCSLQHVSLNSAKLK